MALRNKYLVFSLVTALVIAMFCLLNVGQEENDPRTLYFSSAPGFYDAAFDLEILSEAGGEIFYTLDGSEPTRDAIPYTGPIRIADPDPRVHRYAAITEVSAGFLEEKIRQTEENFPEVAQSPSGYVLPETVDKCTVLRAVAYDGNVELGRITGTYFVGMGEKPEYDGISLVSLVTAPENLFDYDTGIYVLGSKFDEFWEARGKHNGFIWNFWDANYTMRGREYERSGHVEVFGADRSLLLSSDCGIRIHGNVSRSFLPKSLKLYARREYGGSEAFAASPISGSSILPHKFLLFAGGNDRIFMLKDAMVHQLCRELDICTMEMSPCMVFLDGEFWGSSYIAEAYDSKYIYDHYGIPEDSVVIIKEGELSEGGEGDLEEYESMVEFISTRDMTVEENYTQAKDLIDMESYIDYFATMIYLARHQDWPNLNHGAWRAKVSPAGEGYRDGRWRWMLFDLNSRGIGADYVQKDTLEMVLEMDGMFASLWKNEEFKALFASRLKYVAGEVFSRENCSRCLEHYRETMLPAIQANSLRFYGTERTEEILENIRDVQIFFENRPAFVDTMIANHLGEGYV